MSRDKVTNSKQGNGVTPSMIDAGYAALLPFLEQTEGWVDVYGASQAVIEAALERAPYASSQIVRAYGKGSRRRVKPV